MGTEPNQLIAAHASSLAAASDPHLRTAIAESLHNVNVNISVEYPHELIRLGRAYVATILKRDYESASADPRLGKLTADLFDTFQNQARDWVMTLPETERVRLEAVFIGRKGEDTNAYLPCPSSVFHQPTIARCMALAADDLIRNLLDNAIIEISNRINESLHQPKNTD